MRVQTLLLVLVLLVPIDMGASCAGPMDSIRSVHMGVREAGRLADEQIASRLENHGDVCIERAEEAGFSAGSGEEGMEFWRECMSTYIQLDTVITAFRMSLEELENVYQDIDAGRRGESDWRYWAKRVLDHGRTILRLCGEVGVDVPDALQEQLDNLCTVLQCEGSSS